MDRITLVRHGRSAHVHSGWMDRAGVEEWRAAYDVAGIVADAAPAALCERARAAGIIVASDLARAVESAARLVPGAEVIQSPLLRETPLPIPAMWGLRLPLAIWNHVVGVNWLRDPRRPEVADEPSRRAVEAAPWLSDLAATHGSVIVVTHGAFRTYLADALKAAAWRAMTRRPSWDNWSAWDFER